MSDKTADRSDEVDRAAYIEQSKQRALYFWQRGDLPRAMVSMLDDLADRPDCGCSQALLHLGLVYLHNDNHAGVHRWITGFR